jgi:DNA-binding beta-propeller fold protein YncE
MNANTSARWLQSWKACFSDSQSLALVVIFLLAGLSAYSQPVVTTVTDANHGKAGYVDGPTFAAAQFHTPMGIAFDDVYDCLYVADRDNNAIRMLDFGEGQTYTIFPNAYVPTNFISKPVGVALDSGGDILSSIAAAPVI